MIHILLHIRRFGPATLYATEVLEAFNFVIRLRSIHSSRQAPSLEIATSFSHVHAVRHLISGGYVVNDTDGLPFSRPRQAGSSILALINDPDFLQFMIMTGIVNPQTQGKKYYTVRLPSF